MANRTGDLPGLNDLPPTVEEQAREGLVPVAAEDPADLEEARVERELRDGAQGQPEEGAKPSGWEDPRLAIAKKFNENRDALLDGTVTAEQFEDAEYEEDQAEGGDEPELPRRQAPALDPDLDRLVPVQLGNRTVQMRQRDVIALAEEGFTQRPQAAPTQSRAVVPAQQPAERRAQQPTGRPDPAELIGLADKLLSGTPEEASEALADLVEQARQPFQSQADISQAVRTSMLEEALTAEAIQAVDVAQRDYPDIVNDKYRAPLMLHVTVGEFLGAMQKVGVSDELLNHLYRSGPYYVREAYKKLRMDPHWGRQLPTFVDIAVSAGNQTRKAFNLPVPKGVGQPGAMAIDVAGRITRKAALPTLPRPSLQQGQRALPRPEANPEAARNRNAIRDMRLARGQAVA